MHELQLVSSTQLFFVLLIAPFEAHKFLILLKCKLFSFIALRFDISSKSLFQILSHEDYSHFCFLEFYSFSSYISVFDPFELIVVSGVK